MIGCQSQEVVPIAGDEKQTVVARVTECLGVFGMHRHHLPQFNHLMRFLTQHTGNFSWHVMIEEKLHNPGFIWRATKVSISAR